MSCSMIFAVAIPYQNKASDIALIVRQVTEHESACLNNSIDKVEILEAVFFPDHPALILSAGYFAAKTPSPLVIALKNTPEGIIVDAVLMSITDVSILFSYNPAPIFRSILKP